LEKIGGLDFEWVFSLFERVPGIRGPKIFGELGKFTLGAERKGGRNAVLGPPNMGAPKKEGAPQILPLWEKTGPDPRLRDPKTH